MVGLWKFGQTRGDYSEYCPDIQGHSLSNPQSRTYSKSIGITPSKKVIQASKKKRVIFFEIVPPEFQQQKHYAVIENCGVFQPIAIADGKSKCNEDKVPYIRTNPEIIEEAYESSKTKNAMNVIDHIVFLDCQWMSIKIKMKWTYTIEWILL